MLAAGGGAGGGEGQESGSELDQAMRRWAAAGSLHSLLRVNENVVGFKRGHSAEGMIGIDTCKLEKIS